MSQRRRVLRLIVAANIPLVVLILVALWRAHRDEISQITESRVALSQSTALAADAFVGGTVSTLDSLTGAMAGATFDGVRMQRLLQRVLDRNPDWSGAALYDEEGWNLASTVVATPHTTFVGDRAYFREALAGGPALVGQALVSRSTGLLTLPTAVRIDLSNGQRTALVVGLRLDRMFDTVSALQSGPSTRFLLVDRNGQVYLDSAGPDRTVPYAAPNLAFADRLQQGESGAQVERGPDGVEYLYTYAGIPSTGGGVVLMQPASEAFAIPQRLASVGLTLVLLASGVAIGLSVYLGNRLSRLVETAERAQQRAESSAQTLAAVTVESEQRRLFLERLIDTSPIPVLVTEGQQHRIVMANAPARALLPQGALTGRTLREALPPAEHPVLALADRVLCTGEQQSEADAAWELPTADGGTELRYFTFVMARYGGMDGDSEGVLLLAQETTETVLARQRTEADKDEFLSTASHELRTPLTVLSLTAQVMSRTLRRGAHDPEQWRELVEGVMAQTRRANALVDDLLDIARAQAGRLVEHDARTAVDVGDAARAAVKRQQGALDDPDPHHFNLRVDPGAVVECDPGRMDQVLTNLLSNAVKYSPEGGEIDVHVACAGDDVVVRVSDRGIGVPAGEVDTLFTPFGRTRDAASRGIKGTGLGLYISRRIVEALGGTIEYRPTPGGGATFEARFRRHGVTVG